MNALRRRAEPPPCPCCTGAHEGEPSDLCAVCSEAALAGVYPHPCQRNWTDPRPTEETP